MTKRAVIDKTDARIPASRQVLKEAQAQVKRLKRLETELRRQLKKERAGPPPSAEALEAAIQKAQAQVDRIQTAINEAKSRAKKWKREIDEWKQWYQGLPGMDKTADWAKLQGEIEWRGIKINALQERISTLEAKKLSATGHLERVKQNLAALNAGVYDRPLKEDPRLVALQAEREAAATALEAAKASLGSSKQTADSKGDPE